MAKSHSMWSQASCPPARPASCRAPTWALGGQGVPPTALVGALPCGAEPRVPQIFPCQPPLPPGGTHTAPLSNLLEGQGEGWQLWLVSAVGRRRIENQHVAWAAKGKRLGVPGPSGAGMGHGNVED